ncbi:hypothetical protein EDD86DRAFT_243812 [Gorgonomyces haynaldii]|nr:hypothetical protein EDD86DRAFT_243812 [Gorgonomyces haynaldii]
MTSYKKYVVHTLSNDFEKATVLKTCQLSDLVKQLKPHQVIVQAHYLGINASDINFTAGRYDPTVKPPFDCGFEAIGQVVKAGESTKLKPGQAVARALILLPKVDRVFLGLLVSGLTSSLALEYHGHMKSNETVLVTAAAGGAGQIAVQLAKKAGNHVIGTCSSEDKAAFLRKIGCDRVINYKKERLGQVLKKEYPKGVDIVFESVGGEMFQDAVKALSVRGRLIVIGAVSNYAKEVKEGDKMSSFSSVWTDQVSSTSLLAKSTTITGFFLNHYAREMPAHMQKLTQMVMNGSFWKVCQKPSSACTKARTWAK